jgi:hypothetical protein
MGSFIESVGSGIRVSTSKRPSVETISNQMEEDADDWDQFILSLQQFQVKTEESVSYKKNGDGEDRIRDLTQTKSIDAKRALYQLSYVPFEKFSP